VEKIVVTGTRSVIAQTQSPISIDVIEADQLQILSHGTLASALNYIPGVVAKRNLKDGYTVQMQGFDEDHVLILLDGQPLISATGSAVDLDQIGVVDIERIEVLRGAASVLYGSAAMGGVINIISHKQTSNRLKLKYQSSSYANNAIQSGSLNHQLQLDASQAILGWQTSLSMQKVDDLGFDYDPLSVEQTAPSTDKLFVNLGLKKAFANQLELALKSRYFTDDKHKVRSDIPGQDSQISYLSEVQQWHYDLALNQGTAWRLQGRYVKHVETSGDSNALRDADISLAELDGQYVWDLADLDLVSGLVLHRDALHQIKRPSQLGGVSTVEIDDKARESVEAYSQISWPLDGNEIIVGTRVQHDSDFGWHSATRLNGFFTLGEQQQWQVRTGAGQSYRVPTLKERFYVFDHSNLGYIVLGNELLQPETALSTNLEVTYLCDFNSTNQSVTLSANLHYAKAKDFIETVLDAQASVESGLAVSRYSNVEQAVLKGLDVSAKLSLTNVNYQLSYSYLQAKNQLGQHLSKRPKHQIKANLDWQLPFDINGVVYMVFETGTQPSDTQTGVARDHWSSINLSVNQKIAQNWQWTAGVDNLFDTHQQPDSISAGLLDVRPVSSRRIFAGIAYQFY
jgi:outer membrane receptor for ferrienterochelin and colicins